MKKKRRLFWQLYPSFLIIIAISVAAVIWYSSNSLQQFLLNRTITVLEERALILEKLVAGYFAPIDKESIDLVCKEIGALSSARITVILLSGQVIGDSQKDPGLMENHLDRPEVKNAILNITGTSTRYSKTLHKKMMYVAIPVKKKSKIIAVLRTSVPITSLDNELKSIRIKIIFGGLIAALFSAGISFIFSRRISRPLEKMKQGADYFASGDLTKRLNISGSEEMEGLAQAMNHMALQLNERINTIIQQRNELEAVFSSMIEGVIALDSEEHVLSVNQAAAGMFGIDSDKSRGRSIYEVVRNSGLHRFVKKVLSDKKPEQDDIIIEHYGEQILHTYSAPIYDAQKNSIGILLVLNDVTQIRRLENMRQDFVANVSHEIKTPLTAIKGFVETLIHNPFDDLNEVRRFLNIIEKHVNRLHAIIEDLLNLSRLEQENDNNLIKLEERQINSVLRTAVSICMERAAKKNIQIEFSCDKEITAKIDLTLLEQAVVNLIDNAVKYSNIDSTIHVKAFSTDTETIICVKDHGIGISKKHFDRLFERFYRVDKSRSRKLGGTGLGLAIVKHIVKVHKGHVIIKSMPEKGSTFMIHLPFRP